MKILIITIGFSIVAVAFMALALSITRIRTGHDIQGEVGENPNMKRLGLDCAIRDMERASAVTKDENNKILGCGGRLCETCQQHYCDDDYSPHLMGENNE